MRPARSSRSETGSRDAISAGRTALAVSLPPKKYARRAVLAMARVSVAWAMVCGAACSDGDPGAPPGISGVSGGAAGAAGNASPSKGGSGGAGDNGAGAGGTSAQAGATASGGGGGSAGSGGTGPGGNGGSGGPNSAGSAGEAGQAGTAASGAGGMGNAGAAGTAGTSQGGAGAAGTSSGGTSSGGTGGTSSGGAGGTSNGGAGGTSAAGAAGSGVGGATTLTGTLGAAEVVHDHAPAQVIQLAPTKTRLAQVVERFGERTLFTTAQKDDGVAPVLIEKDESLDELVGDEGDERLLVTKGGANPHAMFTSAGVPIPVFDEQYFTTVRFLGEAANAPFCGAFAGSSPSVLCFDTTAATTPAFVRNGFTLLSASSNVLHLQAASDDARSLVNRQTSASIAATAAADGVRDIGFRANRYVLNRFCADCGPGSSSSFVLEWGTVPANFPSSPLAFERRTPIDTWAGKISFYAGEAHMAMYVRLSKALRVYARATGAEVFAAEGVTAFAGGEDALFYAVNGVVYRRSLK